MKIFGLDFSTAPSKTRPSYVAHAEFAGDSLRLLALTPSTKPVLSELLSAEGPWILGLDVPFSVPREFCSAVGWPQDWRGMCEAAAVLPWRELDKLAATFRGARPDGRKEAYRPCDVAAEALPPSRTANPPLLRMFQVAGPMLSWSRVDVVPFRMAGSMRTVVEVYPKLIAKRLSSRPYKHDEQMRQEMLRHIAAQRLRADFGFDVQVPSDIEEVAARNDGGDALDSIFCAIEAAWAWRRGVDKCLPVDGSASEGWIIDPGLAPAETAPHPSDRLRHYGRKCDQHLCRVRLSHRLAIDGLGSGHTAATESQAELWKDAFVDIDVQETGAKLRRGLHEVHLIALKAEFELFLNRVLTVLWTGHFDVLDPVTAKGTVPLRDVIRSARSGVPLRQLIAEHAVPRHGLKELLTVLRRVTGLNLDESLDSKDRCQIRVAFAVRHLIEHTDARVDSAFCDDVREDWARTSWGERDKVPSIGVRIPVEDRDVDCTATSMRRIVMSATDLLVAWSRRQPN